MTAISAVARISYAASDEVVVSLPPYPQASRFVEEYRTFEGNMASKTSITAVPFAANPAAALLRIHSDRLSSLVLDTQTRSMTDFIPPLIELSSHPVVLHIAVHGDLSDVLSLRASVPFMLYSPSASHSYDNSLLASKLAQDTRRLVLHAFEAGGDAGDIPDFGLDAIRSFIIGPTHGTNGHSKLNENTNGKWNGTRANGVNGLNGANGYNRLNGVNGTSGVHGNGDSGDRGSSGMSTPSVADDNVTASLFQEYESALLKTVAFIRRPIRPYAVRRSAHPDSVVVTVGPPLPFEDQESVDIVDVSLIKPFPLSEILRFIPASVTSVVLAEEVHSWTVKWTPLFLELVSALQLREDGQPPLVHSAILGTTHILTPLDIAAVLQRAFSARVSSRYVLGKSPQVQGRSHTVIPHIPAHESSYTKILRHLFQDRLQMENAPELVKSYGSVATSPEYALGRVRGELERRSDLVKLVENTIRSPQVITGPLHDLLTNWLLSKDDGNQGAGLARQIRAELQSGYSSNPRLSHMVALQELFEPASRWIIGSDAWSYDLGSSGLHHLIASGLNVNILLLDNQPYSSRHSADQARRKRDIGLYAMNHGDVYVASVAVYSSYGQTLHALMEADRFNGPSVVLAYLPFTSEDTPALEVLKETKLAVDSGYWPLYRWDPRKECSGKEPFSLDSDVIKNELKEFLDMQNHLSKLSRSTPQFASELVGSLGESLKQARKDRAQKAYEALLSSMSTVPLLVLYASDGGNAEKKAKRLANRGKARGLSTTLAVMDSISLEDIAREEYVVFITSTAGQGEPPQNGRTLFKVLNAAAARGDKPLSNVRFSVFGMGDSHYWPRPEDAQYYNKPGKDLNVRLEQLGAERFTDLGLGDDQDADGPETGYKAWEPLIWKVLGVDSVEVTEAEPEPITNEHMKIASNYLRGTIAEGLDDTTTGAISASDAQLTKFHGIYQQDDRDIRDDRQVEGLEPAYSFMIRVRTPGGVCTPQQWLAMDHIADEHGNGTFKITTRQTFQFHGVIKRHLKPTIQAINRSLLDTLAACGDVNRNVICSAIPTKSKLHAQVYNFSKGLSERLLPRTTAYHEIWLDKKLVAGDAVKDFEPLYGEYYLPRKFKIAVAVPPCNDIDVFANDVGFIAIVDDKGDLAGFNVTAGGGMGVTHGSKKTYPRLGSILGFCRPDQGHDVAEKIMLVQRDNGNRLDRKNARLKYTIDRLGLDAFKAEVEQRLGWSLQPPRAYTFDRNVDDFGWSIGEDGKHNFMVFIENGRVQDEPNLNFKTGLREIAKVHKGTFRMTANQHLMIAEIPPDEVETIKDLLRTYRLDNLDYSGLRLSSSACVAFPTCGLAMAESERYLPILIDKVEAICEENGLRNDSIVMRMTGCPNGCARPYVAEVAFVGKAPGTYLMLLGGGYYGQRLNKIYRETVTEPEILAILRPMIKRYALERQEGEKFGDFVIRAGYISATTEGKAWYDGMGGLGEHREVII